MWNLEWTAATVGLFDVTLYGDLISDAFIQLEKILGFLWVDFLFLAEIDCGMD